MNSKLKAYVDMLFADKPDGSNIRDAKEELLANLNDKYNDLIKNGKSETDAYQLAISGIGEIEDLFQSPSEEVLYNQNAEKTESESQLAKTYEVAKEVENQPIKFAKKESTKKEQEKKIFIFLLWASVVAVFVIISSIGDWSKIAWTIFPFGAFMTILINYVFSNPKKESYIYGMLWTGTVSFYLFIGMLFDGIRWINVWSWSWTIFIFAGIAHGVIKYLLKEKNKGGK